MNQRRRGALLFASLAYGLLLCCFGEPWTFAAPQPLVAVHDSEYTRALETMNASGATPTGPGTTGKQWWPTDWHYFVMPEVVKEALRSDGTAFTVVGDSNIMSGELMNNGEPRYPILISLASEAIHSSEIGPLTNYVAAGGFLFVGSSAFTRNTNGTSRGNFAFANAMGLNMVGSGLNNWAQNSVYTRVGNHRINNHVPAGTLTWRLPSAAEEIPWGTASGTQQSHSNAQAQAPHDVWQVANNGATVIAQGGNSPFLTVKQYGKGYIIYCAAMQPMLGNGGWSPTTHSYLTLRRSIEWAFETFDQPILKLAPWPYQYDAAFIVRHDLESFADIIAAVETSARYEFTNGCTGDYYLCTGTLRENMFPTYNTNNVVASLRRAISNYGATIGPHNGGLTNPMVAATPGSYDYWHWGPDEVLGINPPGYGSGSNYAYVSLSRSFQDIESWFSGLMTNGMRVWCGPYYNSTREASANIQAHLGVKVTGEQKIGPFPHWTLSTQTPNKRFGLLNQPLSDWFVGTQVAHSMEGGHTAATVRSLIDFYYDLGGLVNQYSHSLSHGVGIAGQQANAYVLHAMDTNRFPRLWSANAIKIYNWWLQRSNIVFTVSTSTNGNQFIADVNIRNASSPDTAIELLMPVSKLFCNFQVFTNGVLASPTIYRSSGPLTKIRVGNSVTNASLRYYGLGAASNVFAQNFDGVSAPGLPSGWTTTTSGAGSAWVTQAASSDTSPNSIFSSSVGSVGYSDLISPAFAVAEGQAQLSFRTAYNLESGSGGVGYDGGVLDIKIGSDPFVDIVAAGGSFVSGGYNTVIDNTFESPIAGRSAWSGSSGGYITTLLNLPAAASGKMVQFRWRNASDNGNPVVGWRIDSITVTNRLCLCCISGGTNTPVLPIQSNRTIYETSTLIVTNTASDADPGENLFYSLENPPTGAVISGNGIISWTPSTTFGGTTNVIRTIVTDSTGRTATNSFLVSVLHSNTPPVLPVQTNRTIDELTTLAVTNTATDSDLPANALTYSLTAPAGAAISTNGIITWAPTELQGPSTNTFVTIVTDNGVPVRSATNSFTVRVLEVNGAPLLSPISSQTIHAGTTLSLHCIGEDAPGENGTLTFSLDAAPLTTSINATNGVLTWQSLDADTGSTNHFVVRVTDNGQPPLSDTRPFDVLVVARPIIQGIVITNNVATVTWSAIAGQSYLLQGNDDLTPTNWLDLGEAVSSSGDTASQTNFIFETPLRYYRVRLVP
ncbi:MAG TPA: hypothetical protein VFZ59_24300 [Verrucomicrobiae bacterium]|nr:hypothetical protein [Verrucomicrobiae bacterium]